MREVLLRRLEAAGAADEIAATAALAGRVARERGRSAGALQITTFSGDAVALGRFQAARGAALRRLTGGHAVACGAGVLSLVLVLPAPAAWLDEALPRADRLLNRYVRALLGALRSFGAAASYPGRDVVRADGRAVAYLACERDTRGVCLVQALVGVTASLAPADLEAWPGGACSPLAGAGPLFAAGDARAGRFAEALGEAYARRHALVFREDAPDAEELAARAAGAPPAEASAPGEALAAGPERPIPIGTLRAAVRLGPSGELAAVRLASEWIAASPGVAALEAALTGAACERAALRARIAPVLSAAGHFFLGLDSAESVVEAVLEAGAGARRP
jgi:hypothetical protein